MTDVFTSKMPILEALFTSVSKYSSVFVCLSTCLPASMSVCFTSSLRSVFDCKTYLHLKRSQTLTTIVLCRTYLQFKISQALTTVLELSLIHI